MVAQNSWLARIFEFLTSLLFFPVFIGHNQPQEYTFFLEHAQPATYTTALLWTFTSMWWFSFADQTLECVIQVLIFIKLELSFLNLYQSPMGCRKLISKIFVRSTTSHVLRPPCHPNVHMAERKKTTRSHFLFFAPLKQFLTLLPVQLWWFSYVD